MITGISKEVENILMSDDNVFSYRCVRSEEELRSMINTDKTKSVGYSIVPLEIDANGAVLSELTMFIIDISNDDINVLNASVDTNILVAKNMRLRLSSCTGRVTIDTEYMKSEDNDYITVLTKCIIKCLT